MRDPDCVKRRTQNRGYACREHHTQEPLLGPDLCRACEHPVPCPDHHVYDQHGNLHFRMTAGVVNLADLYDPDAPAPTAVWTEQP